MTRALITGARGFVGPYLIDHLHQQGDETIGLDLTCGPDLRDHQGWVDIVSEVKPEVIYHLAGWSDTGGSWKDPVATFAANATGTLNVLEAARQAGTGRVVIISSADVYGIVDGSDLPVTEELPARPRSPYGASKQAAESLALQYHRGHGLDVIVARPFNHIGPGQRPQFAVPAFAAQIATAEAKHRPDNPEAKHRPDNPEAGAASRTKLFHGDLSARRDLTDVRDVVRAYRLLAEQGRPGEIYNVCSGTDVSMGEILQTLIDMSPVDIQPCVDPDRLRPVELPVLRGSAEKLAQETGWRREHSLDQTLASVLDDARQSHHVDVRTIDQAIG